MVSINDSEMKFTNFFKQGEGHFKHLSNNEFEELISESICKTYKKGSVIFPENTRTKGIYIVVSGILKMFKTGLEGKNQIIKFAKKDDIFGYRSVLSNELTCTSAKVIEETTLCFISKKSLLKLLNTNVLFTKELLLLACKELGDANSYITNVTQKSVRERIAETLVSLTDEFGLDNDNILQISLTREEFANIVGTATESIIRLLSEFKSDNLIELQGRKIKIVNILELKKTGNIFF